MKIRIKIKHLMFILIGLIILIPFISFVVKPQIELYVAREKLEQGKFGKEKVVELLNSSILQSQKWDLMKDYIIEESSRIGKYDVIVGPSMTQIVGNPELNFTWNEKLEYLQDFVEKGPLDGYLSKAAIQLSAYYQREGQLERAENVLLKSIERLSDNRYTGIEDELRIELIKLMINLKNYEKAENYIDVMNKNLSASNFYMKAEVVKLRSEMIIQKGDMETAYEKVNNELKEFKIDWEQEKQEYPEIAGDTPVVYEQLQALKDRLGKVMTTQQNKLLVTVKGKVIRSDGTPVQNAGVFLREEQDVNKSVSVDEPYQLITDENGEFELQNVFPGNYQISLGFTFDQIDGWSWPTDLNDWIDIDGNQDITYNVTLHPLIEIKSPVNQQKITEKQVHFAWDHVDGAAYYNIHLGADVDSGSIEYLFKTQIKDNQLTVPIEDFYKQTTGVVFEDITDLSKLDPKSILGFANTKNRYSWNVRAFNAEGEMITQSNGYRLNEDTIGNLPFFYLQERKLTKADRHLLDKKNKEAFAAYQESYNKDPNDLHSLRMINRLMRAQPLNVDEAQELSYLIALAEKSPSSGDVFDLVDYYYKRQEWSSFNKWFEQYSKLVNGHLSDYDQGILASALMRQGKLTEARNLFKKVLENDNSHRFIGSLLAVEIHLRNSFETVVELADKYPERPFGSSPKNWSLLIDNLVKERDKYDNYHQELRNVLDLYFKNNEAALTKWLNTTNKKAMKKFIESVMEVD
ncbi:carboxypeptidase-like regulatory domain-containing protein [Fredinandcohnia quinoae]|uniref:Carboxypeptidase-like regulatory domain-containing protein n=1 Tax=Fredinandcohnia quinoae TaxID=2918902 RepID=A0AAW5EF25_9BACI|nr:carboxypeptidase-like regulatory domain-containing protein [Fredinandcohnia sp. SECRCQ15]MCH1627384.1 carboxypeptidase-like regulatory domain-containing protein [Fredinandcohnia sp. SECRCQ15]